MMYLKSILHYHEAQMKFCTSNHWKATRSLPMQNVTCRNCT